MRANIVTMILRTLVVLLALAAAVVAQDGADEPTEAQRRSRSYWLFEAPLPSPEELAENPSEHEELLSANGLSLDVEGRALRARAGVIHDLGTLTYPIEYLIVTDRGQVHEAIFMVAARPLLVNRCLRALGLEPGTGMSYEYTNDNRTAWMTYPAHGELVDIVIEWIGDDGKRREVPLEDMLVDLATGDDLEGRGWIYIGSRMAMIRRGLEDVERYLADVEGNIAAIYLDGRGACLFERNSLRGVDTPYTLHPDRVPPRDTQVTIAFRPTGRRVDEAEAIPGGIVLAGGPDAERHDALAHEYAPRDEWLRAGVRGATFGAGGEIYAATPRGVAVVDPGDGSVLRTLPVDGGVDVVALDPSDADVVWTLSRSAARVVAVDATSGDVVASLAPPTDDWRPTDVALDEDDHVFVADAAGSVVHRFGTDGALQETLGAPGDGLGEFGAPSAVAIDTRGRFPHLLVADRADGRIQAFDTDGRYLAVVARRLDEPVSLSIRGRFLVVTEAGGRLSILDEIDRVVATLDVDAPRDADWNPRGDLFVTDAAGLRRLDRVEGDE